MELSVSASLNSKNKPPMSNILMYTRFERFWHWSQALAIIILGITGFEIHGTYQLLGFRRATQVHEVTAYALMGLVIFSIFWHFTTGEWKQYIPTRKHLLDYIKYYISGIFNGAEHPTHKTKLNKLNPLQRLTYLGLKLTMFPPQIVLGLIYMYYPQVKEYLPMGIGLQEIAFMHVAFAYLFFQFLIVHIYLTTTGKTVTSNVKAMITGYEEV
jgi:thiosulfate reductase cytochrome b subunit